MKQLAQYQDGRLEMQEVPEPTPPPGGILVRTACSVISPGTERMKVEQAKMSLIQKAKARPDQVRQVLDTARTLGWKAAAEKVRNRLETPTPLGYSAAGEVIAVDAGHTRFKVGDRVAVGGAECAFHAETLAIPSLLAARVPEGVEMWQASYTTLAAIALQALREADVRIGERVLVVGQGLIGLLATSLLRSTGARVAVSDLDPHRLTLSHEMGAEITFDASTGPLKERVLDWSHGHGVDQILLCAAGSTVEMGRDLIHSLRQRGRLVVVGMSDLHLEWKQAYQKEIEVRYARSYGPGRHDPSYEWGGIDYPQPYVRWTEGRQFECCLHLMQRGDLDLVPITTRRVRFEDALQVYHDLTQPGCQDLGVVLEYSAPAVVKNPVRAKDEAVEAVNAPCPTLPSPLTQLDVVGAGNFVRSMLLPHLKGKVELRTVVNRHGLSARHAREKFGFTSAETDLSRIWEAPPAALLIGTRHDLHAEQVLEGLRRDRHVFVEKPLCLTRDELERIGTAAASSSGSVMVGFNRRFAPATAALRRHLSETGAPVQLAYHVNAGPLSKDHWYSDPAQSGGRILGEVCHFLDWIGFVLESPVTHLHATRIRREQTPFDPEDSVSVQLEFASGSVAQLIYATGSSGRFPKESCRLFGEGWVAELENYLQLEIHRNGTVRKTSFSSKGHAEEIQAWTDFLAGKAPHPLPLAEAIRSTELTLEVASRLHPNIKP